MPYTDEDRYIRANIRSLLGSLIAAPEAAPSLLNAAQKWNSIYDYGKYLGVSGAAIDSAWNLGGINTASLVKSAIQLRSAGVSTLLKNGLLEELISIEPHTAENILQNIIAHPFIKEQRNTLGMAYLNDQETVECAQLILKFARNLPPKAIAELGNSVANLLEKTPKKEQEASKTNTPSPYQPIIESIVNKTFLEAALDQPKIIEGTILPSLMSYLAEPDSATLKQVVSAITELASQSNVREVLTPVVDHKLINNIFNLPQLKDSPYRTLAYDLAKGEPEQFRKLANAILSSSAQKDLKPITAKLLDFIDLPKIESPENDRVFDDLVLSLVKLIAKPNIKKEVVPILNVELFDNIFNLPKLSESPYGQLIHNLTKNQPEHFQKLASAILTNPFEKELKPVFSKILDFIHLPKVASPKNDKVFDDLVLSLVDLLSKPKVRDKVKPLMTVGLIDDIFDLPQLSDSPYRKLVHDLAEDQPKEFQELFNSMLSSSFLTDLKPFMSSLLEFTRLPSGAPNSDKVFNEFMDSLLSMSAKPPIPAKLALLLTPKTINNLFALPQLKKMSSFKIIAKKTASAISKHPKDIEAMLKTYNDFKRASDNPAKKLH